jgi:hypothetical protein
MARFQGRDENLLLKGEDPVSCVQVNKKVIQQNNMGYFKTPFARYEIDKIKTYKKF